MARAAHGIDYLAELDAMRDAYVKALPWQRLSVIRLRLKDHHFGPNRLVTSVSAVEGLARCLAIRSKGKTKTQIAQLYGQYRNRSPNALIEEYMLARGIKGLDAYFGEDTWKLFGYAVKYRNLIAHECTYLGLDKFPSLIESCEQILEKLTETAGLRGKRT